MKQTVDSNKISLLNALPSPLPTHLQLLQHRLHRLALRLPPRVAGIHQVQDDGRVLDLLQGGPAASTRRFQGGSCRHGRKVRRNNTHRVYA